MAEDTHVIALLGKSHANQSGEISREFARRLDAFVHVLSETSAAHLHIAICGQREAQPAMDWLRREHAHRLPRPARRFVDEVSRNSVQNIEALGGYLATLRSAATRRVRLTIVSSDYHVTRLQFVDEHLRPQSLLRRLTPLIAPETPGWRCAPFSPPPDAADAIRWCSRVYLLAEMLMPLQINIEGILQLRLDRIVDAVCSRFCSSLSALETSLDSPPAQIQSDFRPTLEAVDNSVRSILKLRDRLAAYLESAGGPDDELEDILQVLRNALPHLRDATDLDGREFDGVYGTE